MKALLILCLAVVGLAGFASTSANAAVNTPAALPAVAHINAEVVVETGGPRYYHHRHYYHRHYYHRRWYYRHHRRYYY